MAQGARVRSARCGGAARMCDAIDEVTKMIRRGERSGGDAGDALRDMQHLGNKNGCFAASCKKQSHTMIMTLTTIPIMHFAAFEKNTRHMR
jgi:hypothetical protein